MNEENRRVYPSGGFPGKLLTYAMLFFSLVLILAGLFGKNTRGGELLVQVMATPEPTLSTDVFDETPETREMTLPATTWYAIQLGAFENEASAKEMASQYQSRGAAGYVLKDTRYRVLAALYDTREDAQTVRAQLQDKHNIEAYIYEVKLGGISLRVEGKRGQLDTLQSAFSVANELTLLLQKQAVLMDKQEQNLQEAQTALRALGDRAREVSLRLTQRFVPPRNEAVQTLSDCLSEFAGYAAALPDDGLTMVDLATQVKYQALEMLFGLKLVYESF